MSRANERQSAAGLWKPREVAHKRLFTQFGCEPGDVVERIAPSIRAVRLRGDSQGRARFRIGRLPFGESEPSSRARDPDVAALVAALIGAVVGSVGAVVVQHWLVLRAERAGRRQLLVQRHLFQLLESMETRRYRIVNLGERSGASRMTPTYRSVSTLYAIGTVLAIERIFDREAVYFELERLYPGLGSFLKQNRFDSALGGVSGIHHYRRVALADAVSERDGDRFRTRPFLEFARAYRTMDAEERDEWLVPLLERFESLPRDTLRGLADKLESSVARLAQETELDALRRRTSPRNATGEQGSADPARAHAGVHQHELGGGA